MSLGISMIDFPACGESQVDYPFRGTKVGTATVVFGRNQKSNNNEACTPLLKARDFGLIEANEGLILSFPARQNEKGQWKTVLSVMGDLRSTLAKTVLQAWKAAAHFREQKKTGGDEALRWTQEDGIGLKAGKLKSRPDQKTTARVSEIEILPLPCSAPMWRDGSLSFANITVENALGMSVKVVERNARIEARMPLPGKQSADQTQPRALIEPLTSGFRGDIETCLANAVDASYEGNHIRHVLVEFAGNIARHCLINPHEKPRDRHIVLARLDESRVAKA